MSTMLGRLSTLAVAVVALLIVLILPVAAQELPRISIESAMPGVRVESVFVSGDEPLTDVPPGSVSPGHQRLRFTNYYTATFELSDYNQPEIWIMRMDELAPYGWDKTANELMLVMALRPNLSQMRQLPYLPLANAAQVFHVQERYLDFVSGIGLRYVTFFAQDATEIEGNRLIYSYQGYTNDKKYYVAGHFPVAAAVPPPPPGLFDIEDPDFVPAYNAYLNEVVTRLRLTDPEAFTPPLSQLDATVQSLTIR